MDNKKHWRISLRFPSVKTLIITSLIFAVLTAKVERSDGTGVEVIDA
jgi:hypothetical protein